MSNFWRLQVDALGPDDQPVTLRFCTPGYRDSAPVRWRARIQQPGLFAAGLYAGQLISVPRAGYGETTLINNDGALNELVDYAMDGRRALLELVSNGTATTVLDGTVGRVSFQRSVVSIRLRDPAEPLQQPHPNNRYAGDNVLPEGLEGTDDDLGGNVKPRLYGQVRNANIGRFAVNTARLVYQVSDQPATVLAVFDNGVALDNGGAYSSLAQLHSDPPEEGEYRSYQGYVRLGVPPVGELTCDADAPLTAAGDVVAQIAEEAGVTVDSVGALNSRGAVRLWVTEEARTADLIDRLVASCAGYWRLTRTGTLEAGLLAPPATTPVLTLRDHAIITIEREAAGAGDNGLPVGRVTWQADRIETVQTELTDRVPTERRARLASPTRDAVAVDAATLERHPLAAAVTVASDLASRSHAATVANDVLALLSPRRDRVSVIARARQAAGLLVNQTVRIETPRLGYTSGRNLLIVGREVDASKERVTLTLWG
ncbi:hypothetical protein CLM76_09450 [Vreelandella venusta]|nr:hypothetical protein CLM76_09450 [Halomonas hydrothermalis]